MQTEEKRHVDALYQGKESDSERQRLHPYRFYWSGFAPRSLTLHISVQILTSSQGGGDKHNFFEKSPIHNGTICSAPPALWVKALCRQLQPPCSQQRVGRGGWSCWDQLVVADGRLWLLMPVVGWLGWDELGCTKLVCSVWMSQHGWDLFNDMSAWSSPSECLNCC